MTWQGEEKRKFPRAEFPCKIIVYTPTKHSFLTHTENISEGGVRFLLEEKLQISSLVDLEIFLKEPPLSCRGRVVWVVARYNPILGREDFFDTGIEFYEINKEDQETIAKLIEGIS